MTLNLDAVGHVTEPLIHEYGWKDVVLYALGVGATRDEELDYLYEGRGPKVLPTYAVVPAFAATRALFDVVGGDLVGVVHLHQAIEIHKPFAPSGRLSTVGKVDGIYDLKRFAQCYFSTETHDAEGDHLCTTRWQIVFRNDGGFDGPRPPASEKVRLPSREPDFEVQEKTQPEQALLYRLSGDLNPLHADPAIGEQAGFGTPILHGLCTYGYAGRAVLRSCLDGDPARLRGLVGQFRKPVWPGETLVVRGWREEDRVILRVTTLERPDENPLTNAYALIG